MNIQNKRWRWPTFLLLGVPRAGTTSVNGYLGQHPDVFMSPVKEPHYFDFMDGMPAVHGRPTPDMKTWWASRITTEKEYRRLFDGVQRETAVGEATPNYLAHPACAKRIHVRLPQVTLLAILRHPIERAFSHYCHNVRNGLEPAHSFDEALDQEQAGRRDSWDLGWRYATAGLYWRQLGRYLERFDARQIHLFFYEDLQRKPQAFMQSMFQALNVDPSFVPDTSAVKNVNTGIPNRSRLRQWLGHIPDGCKRTLKPLIPARLAIAVKDRVSEKSRVLPCMPAQTRSRLLAFFAEDIVEIETYTGRSLEAWRR